MLHTYVRLTVRPSVVSRCWPFPRRSAGSAVDWCLSCKLWNQQGRNAALPFGKRQRKKDRRKERNRPSHASGCVRSGNADGYTETEAS